MKENRKDIYIYIKLKFKFTINIKALKVLLTHDSNLYIIAEGMLI